MNAMMSSLSFLTALFCAPYLVGSGRRRGGVGGGTSVTPRTPPEGEGGDDAADDDYDSVPALSSFECCMRNL